MKAYLDIVEKVLSDGSWKENRTGIRALGISGAMFEHDLALGFPALTTKRLAFKQVAIELEFFIKGLTDKKWLQERGCHIWDEWCNPDLVPPELSNEERKKFQRESDDLGPIYGSQWRNFHGVDQLKGVVETLHSNPNDRRMVVSAWNPPQHYEMALPPCHVLWQVIVTGDGKLNLNWYQRSVDSMLGLPFNIASYALLLELLARQVGKPVGKLCGFLGDVHIYENHINQAKVQILRDPLPLPKLELTGEKNIFDWTHVEAHLLNYKHHGKLEFEMSAI